MSAPEQQKDFTTITLDTPITRGKTTIAEVVLRNPKGGDLRGLTLIDVSMSKFDALSTLIPRISQPIIHAQDLKDMSAADIFALGIGVVGFFVKAEAETPAE